MLVGIQSARFELRPIGLDEGINDHVRWLNDPEVSRFIHARNKVHDPDTVRDYVASHDNVDTFLLGIFDLRDGTYIGNHRIERDPYNCTCALGALIGDKRYWRRGVLTETRAAVLDLVFSRLDGHKAWANVVARNIAVVASYQNLGFRCEGILREHRLVEGRHVDVVQFGMVRDEWIKRRNIFGDGQNARGPLPEAADRGGD
jgi:RimJ/RimL family protein N-acetyltransferase